MPTPKSTAQATMVSAKRSSAFHGAPHAAFAPRRPHDPMTAARATEPSKVDQARRNTLNLKVTQETPASASTNGATRAIAFRVGSESLKGAVEAASRSN